MVDMCKIRLIQFTAFGVQVALLKIKKYFDISTSPKPCKESPAESVSYEGAFQTFLWYEVKLLFHCCI